MSDCTTRCTFPACRCEWSKRGEHCPRYGGTTKGYEPPPKPAAPWGHKLTVHVYVAGERAEDEALRLADAVNTAIPDAAFVGIDVAQVQREPRDQVAS